MKIAIACDHGGLAPKRAILAHFAERYEFHDFGTNDTASCDYPLFAVAASEAVARGECDRAVLVCTTGIGMCIAANKVKGIRCALCTEPYTAKMTRLHNDANALSLGAGVVGEKIALEIVETFLSTEFTREERHQRRIDQITAAEGKN